MGLNIRPAARRQFCCCALVLVPMIQLNFADAALIAPRIPDYMAIPDHWQVFGRQQQDFTNVHSIKNDVGTDGNITIDGTVNGEQQAPTNAIPGGQGASRGSPRSTTLEPPYNICMGQWTPMTTCSLDSAQEEFTGYSVELFRVLAAQVGWSKDDYNFVCYEGRGNWAVELANQNCSASMDGIVLSPEALTSGGVKFTWPIYKTAMRIMVHAPYKQGGTFAFLDAFHWSLWLVIFLTAVAVGLLVAFLEWLGHRNKRKMQETPTERVAGWQTWLWYSLAKMVDIVPHTSDPATGASRFLFAPYAFLMLVMVSMYTAGSAGTITPRRFDNPFPRGVADLAGRRVGTWSNWADFLKLKYLIDPVPLPWDNDEDLTVMFEKLRAGEFEALILDSPSLEYFQANNEACDLFIIGGLLTSFSINLAFARTFDAEVVHSLSQAIIMSETYFGGLSQFEQAYIKLGGQINDCILPSMGHGEGDQLSVLQVSGLWIMLKMCVAGCFVLLVVHNIQKDPKQRAAAIRVLTKVSSIVPMRPSWAGGQGSQGGASEATSPHRLAERSMSQRIINKALLSPLGGALAHVHNSLASFTAHSTHLHSLHLQQDGSQPGSNPETPSKWRALLGFTSSSGDSFVHAR